MPTDPQPLFWVRIRSDGGFEGPIHDSALEDVRKRSGAWTPLYTAPPPVAAGVPEGMMLVPSTKPTVEDINSQDWAGMDGAIAFHLIDRHGENWSHTGRLMHAWRDAAAPSAPAADPAPADAVAGRDPVATGAGD